MKIYSEEQIRQTLDLFISPTSTLKEEFILQLKPIELPSDEEIVEYADRVFEQDDAVGKLIWSEGAKFMKKQILNQNK